MDLTFSSRTATNRLSTQSFMATHIDEAGGSALPKEIEEGNVEYKLKLINTAPERLQHLVTQMKWRLAEGHGEAIYEIGVSDRGELVGLSRRDMAESLKTLRKMGEMLNADVSIIRERVIHLSHQEYLRKERMLASYSSSQSLVQDDEEEEAGEDEDGFGFSLDLDDVQGPPSPLKSDNEEMDERVVAEVLVRKGLEDDRHFLEIRVAIVGGAGAGKSTLLGVLADSDLDNGRGKSRLNLLRHRHEIETGRTSSISHQIIGFDARGDLVNYGSTNISTLEQICEASAKIVSFLDMCGHPKYQKTTLSGLTGHSPDYACLIIGANSGSISEVPREHLGIAVALRVPVFIVMTKVDCASTEQLTKTVNSLLRLLKSPGIRRVPMVIQNEDDLVVAVSSLVDSRVIPIFLTSSVTGENMKLLEKFLNLLPKPSDNDSSAIESPDANAVEFSIEETYNIPGLGVVVGGLLTSGQLWSPQSLRSETYYLGPDRGRFVPVRIASIHRQRIPIAHLVAGQAATCSIHFVHNDSNPDGEDFFSPSGIHIRAPSSPSRNSDGHSSQHPPAGFKVRKGQVLLAHCPDAIATTAGTGSIPNSPSLAAQQNPLVTAAAATPKNTASTPKSSLTNTSVFRPALPVSACAYEFDAEIHVIHAVKSKDSSEVAVGTSGVAFLGSVRQGVRIIKLQDSTGKWAGLVNGDVSVNELSGGGAVDCGEDVGVSGDFFIVPAKGTRRRSSSVVSNRPLSGGGKGGGGEENSDSKRNSLVVPDSPSLSAAHLKKGSEAPESPLLSATLSRRALVSFDLGPSVEAEGNNTAAVATPSGVSVKRSTTPVLASPRRNEQKLIIGSITSPTQAASNALTPPPPFDAGLDHQVVPVLKTGEHGRIRLRFSHEPEWIKVGSTVLFRGEGRLKCVGKVVGVVAATQAREADVR